jgi:diguanylate cyclase (GGDEF)-like protein
MAGMTTDLLHRSASARLAAAADRSEASEDRQAGSGERMRAEMDREGGMAERRSGATERAQAEADRQTARADRWAGAGERRQAETDRDTALADRGAGVSERKQAGFDRETASADRGAGASERSQAELDRNTALANRGASASEREGAFVDDLTGVYLRGPGFVELEREMARARRTGRPLFLAFIDVDGLKATNDEHGHAAGDRALLAVATAVRAQLRSYDLIFRYGGDEFVCAFSVLNIADAAKRLALVNVALALTPERGSVTFGLAELLPDDSAADLVARADAALYRERATRRGGTTGG